MKVTIPLEDEETQGMFADCEPGEVLTFTVSANNGASLEGELEKGEGYEDEGESETEAESMPMAKGKKMPKALMLVVGK